MHLPIQVVMVVDPEAWAAALRCEPEQVAENIGRYLEQQIAGLELMVETSAAVVVKAADVRPPTHKAQGAEGAPK